MEVYIYRFTHTDRPLMGWILPSGMDWFFEGARLVGFWGRNPDFHRLVREVLDDMHSHRERLELLFVDEFTAELLTEIME